MEEGGPYTGRIIAGRYELEALIGRGGVGEVWRARHLALDSPVAIKFLHASSRSGETGSQAFHRRGADHRAPPERATPCKSSTSA